MRPMNPLQLSLLGPVGFDMAGVVAVYWPDIEDSPREFPVLWTIDVGGGSGGRFVRSRV